MRIGACCIGSHGQFQARTSVVQSTLRSRRNGEPLYRFVLTQFRTEGYGETAEPTTHTFPGIALVGVAIRQREDIAFAAHRAQE
ncbi:hypothetical protein, partial [Mesorhizobium sp. M2A.F.Ca.ET.017.03.2.1]|uniref:hypothetical protein n=1 Tax=Mesorhizobium sp. M2A.F.Ca.ET.017.03.2.1 TaxID=2496650 RepID=UPI001AECF53C